MIEARELVVHGQRLVYRAGGGGPVVVLLHGMARSSESWADVLARLATRYTVVAPDLIGHGRSARPATDYSLGAHACAVRDLLGALGHDSATIVGHSYGGGVAMQFAYQFPERCDRLVLVASGGLGREVHPVLRALALPGAELVLPLVGIARNAFDGVARALGWMGFRASAGMEEIQGALASLADADSRRALLHTVRAVIDAGGQRVSAIDRLYLAAALPTMIVWGDRDPIIPVAHGRAAHDAMPGSRLEVFSGCGHFPHRDDPWRFADVLEDFLTATRPVRLDERAWRELLRVDTAAAG